MRMLLHGFATLGLSGLLFVACGGEDAAPGGASTGGGGAASGGSAGAAGAPSTPSGGGLNVGGGGGGAAGGAGGGGGAAGAAGAVADANVPDVTFAYNPPEGGSDDACAAVAVTPDKPPVDVIWIIDQSSSMSDEIAQVKANVNGHFAKIIQDSGLDFRVVMFANADYPVASRRVCVLPPLGAANCGDDNPPRFFQINKNIESLDSLVLFTSMTWWDQIKTRLRSEAFKAFVEVTDDQSSLGSAQFDEFLLKGSAAGYFGTAAKRRYVFHSIVGVSTPLGPSAAATTDKCPSAENPGPQYQELSVLTGGLRHPVCDTDYSDVFKDIATSIVNAVSCELLTPNQADAGVIDWSKVKLQYTPGTTGSAVTLPQVAGPSACAGSPGFFYDDPTKPKKVTLCPASCSTVSTDKAAKIELLLGCQGS